MKKAKTKTYSDKIIIEIDSFDLSHLIGLLTTELEQSKDISTIKCWIGLLEYLQERYDEPDREYREYDDLFKYIKICEIVD